MKSFAKTFLLTTTAILISGASIGSAHANPAHECVARAYRLSSQGGEAPGLVTAKGANRIHVELRKQFGGAGPTDFNGDGRVDIRDFNCFRYVTTQMMGLEQKALAKAQFFADTNFNGTMAAVEYAVAGRKLRDSMGSTSGTATFNPDVDFNGDNTVNIADFLVLQSAYNLFR